MSSLNRTYHPKWVTYNGDGNGRDQYIIFNNGGLNELRDYRGQQPNGFNLGKIPTHKGVTPVKEATAFDYIPDGSGRDSYIIRAFGLKRDYKSGYREFERGLRAGSTTPLMDSRQMQKIYPFGNDSTRYNNWPSPKAVAEGIKAAKTIRSSIERLTQSPARTSPMAHYLKNSATIEQDPKAVMSSLRKKSINVDPVFKINQVSDQKARTSSGFFTEKNLNSTFQVKRASEQPLNKIKEEFANNINYSTIGNAKSRRNQRGVSYSVLQQEQGKLPVISQIEAELIQKQGEQQMARKKLALSNLDDYSNSQFATMSTLANHAQNAGQFMGSGFKPKRYRMGNQKRIPLGHNIQLDDVDDNKIVNNSRTLFFRSQTPVVPNGSKTIE